MKSIVKAIWGEKWVSLLAGDALLLGFLLVLAGVLVFPATSPSIGPSGIAEVTGPGGWSARLDLDRGGTTRVPGPLGETVVEVAEGRARVVSSPCARGLCSHGGWVGGGGGVLVCVPNGVVVRVAAPPGADVDARTR